MTSKRIFGLGLVPLVLLLAAMVALAPEHKDTSAGQARAFEPSHHFRSVVFILDSAGRSEMFDPELMPFLSSLRTSSVSGRSRSCAAKATFPCIKSTGLSSKDFAWQLLEQQKVACVPGSAFGSSGEGYVRACFANES